MRIADSIPVLVSRKTESVNSQQAQAEAKASGAGNASGHLGAILLSPCMKSKFAVNPGAASDIADEIGEEFHVCEGIEVQRFFNELMPALSNSETATVSEGLKLVSSGLSLAPDSPIVSSVSIVVGAASAFERLRNHELSKSQAVLVTGDLLLEGLSLAAERFGHSTIAGVTRGVAFLCRIGDSSLRLVIPRAEHSGKPS